MKSVKNKMWKYRLKRTVILSLLSGLFVMPCHAGAVMEVMEYTYHSQRLGVYIE